jgi:type IV pilus assembly protein PilW
MATNRSSRRQRGFSLIEIMVGIVIGMIAVLVIYQIFSAAEGIRRNTTGIGDAQQNGLLSSFMLSIELANASNGVAVAISDLLTCPATGDPATTFRPIPILITDGGAGSDRFVVNYSLSNSGIVLAPFKANAAAGNPYVVQSPLGFQVGDIVVAVSEAGDCAASQVANITAPDANGQVTITPSPAATFGLNSGAYLVNMGPSGGLQRVLYDVNNGVLRSTSLWDANGQPAIGPSPTAIAPNVVAMKLQYGVVDPATNILSWVSATGPWSDAAVLAANAATLRQIQAVRIGVVVQSEQFDKDLAQQIPSPTWSLFCNPGPCLMGALTAGFRYRSYETSVPLRNPVWNL